jgi:hypothetical protein
MQFTMVVNQRNQKHQAAASIPLPVSKKQKQQIPPEFMRGSRLIISLYQSFRDKKNVPVRVVLDTESDTPMMSKQWADVHGVP